MSDQDCLQQKRTISWAILFEETVQQFDDFRNAATTIHLLNGNIGIGVLSMYIAINNVGLVGGVLGMVFVALITIHSCYWFSKTFCSKVIYTDRVLIDEIWWAWFYPILLLYTGLNLRKTGSAGQVNDMVNVLVKSKSSIWDKLSSFFWQGILSTTEAKLASKHMYRDYLQIHSDNLSFLQTFQLQNINQRHGKV